MSESLVLHRSFYCPAMNKEKRYTIYLPPSYRYQPEARYSAVYLLPGLMDYEMTWVEKGRVHEHMDHLIYSGTIGEMIVVMPDKDDAALDPHRKAEFAYYLGRDLVGHIDYEFRTIASRYHRGIEGLSLGASWAIFMGAHFPEMFCSVGCLSGGFGDDIYRTIWEKKEYLHELGMRFRVGVGAWEPEFIPGNEKFVHFLRDLGFFCEFEMTEGPHDWPLWVKQIYNSLQFHFYSFNPVHA
ncbi:MAG: alpha/beta hydrolase-fold protein [Candidatus Eremiobacteraeota bacterium]|nr:alpha/beta hydrolase-fold protein [Candidatus Eremiobacteraeota bacterium]